MRARTSRLIARLETGAGSIQPSAICRGLPNFCLLGVALPPFTAQKESVWLASPLIGKTSTIRVWLQERGQTRTSFPFPLRLSSSEGAQPCRSLFWKFPGPEAESEMEIGMACDPDQSCVRRTSRLFGQDSGPSSKEIIWALSSRSPAMPTSWDPMDCLILAQPSYGTMFFQEANSGRG